MVVLWCKYMHCSDLVMDSKLMISRLLFLDVDKKVGNLDINDEKVVTLISRVRSFGALNYRGFMISLIG